MDITVPYYEDMTRISNSNIGWFLKKGPRYLKDMLDGKIEGMKASFLSNGTMIHEWILQKSEFWKDYLILDSSPPRSAQQKLFCEIYANTDPFKGNEEAKIEAYRKAYRADKLTDEKCVLLAEEIIMVYQDYLEYLSLKDKKTIISYADHQKLTKIEENLRAHKKANELLYAYPDTFEIYNEFHINWEYPNASSFGDIPCKSLLDRLMIDHKNKKIILVDIKTTADVYNFKHSVEEFDYCRQLAYYWLAIHWYFKNELKLNIEEYEYETYIIAVQSHDGYEVKVFKFNPKTIEERLVTISYAMKQIAWHKDTNKWDFTKAYYDGDGTESLTTIS